MANTGQTQNQSPCEQRETLLHNISVVLVNPKYAGNVGFAARCLKNMGIGNLLVVRQKAWASPEVQATATPFARDVVEAIEYYRSMEDALAPMGFVVGMTARKGSARGPQVSPREAAQEIVRFARNNRVALVFGCEDKGLSNSELRFCHLIVNIPTAPQFTSINLSHAVLILCYEIFLAVDNPPQHFVPQVALLQETEAMFIQMRDFLQHIDFLKKKDPEYWLRHIRQFFGRTKVLSKDVKIVRGIMRQIEWKINQNNDLNREKE